jgi:hypothetical protein
MMLPGMDLISKIVKGYGDLPTRVDYPLSNLRVFIRRNACCDEYGDRDDNAYGFALELLYLILALTMHMGRK